MNKTLKNLKSGERASVERGIYAYRTKTGEIKYGISYRVNGRRHKEIIGSKTLAKTMLAKRRTEIAEGRFKLPKRKAAPTFRSFGEQYIEDVKGVLKDWKRDKLAIDAAAEIFGEKRLDQIEKRDLVRLRTVRVNQVKPRTCNRDLSTIRRVLNVAEEFGHIDKNPARKIEMLKPEPLERRILDYDEEAALIEHAADHLKPVLRVGFDLGLRIGDLLALQWYQIDLDAKTITAKNSKSKKVQRFRMTPQVEATLRALPHRDGAVFQYKGEPIQSVKKSFESAVTDSKIRRATPHDMRRTFATRLHSSGVPLAKIQALLGHQDIQTTMKYIGITVEDLDSAMDVLADDRSRYWRERGVVSIADESTTKVPRGEIREGKTNP
jgi:integrase